MTDVAIRPRTVLSLCAGYGGLDLALGLACPGIRLVGAVERQAYAAAVLASRMVEGSMDRSPVFDDMESFRGEPYRGRVDLVVAGFPCQGASVAGKRLGTDDPRWLWPEVLRIFDETAARWLFIENVPGLLSVNGGRALETIIRDLGARGLAAEWDCLSAGTVGAPHIRYRFFLLATDADSAGLTRERSGGELDGAFRTTRGSDVDRRRGPRAIDAVEDIRRIVDAGRSHWEWGNAPLGSFRRVDDGSSNWLDGGLSDADEAESDTKVSSVRSNADEEEVLRSTGGQLAFFGSSNVRPEVHGSMDDEAGRPGVEVRNARPRAQASRTGVRVVRSQVDALDSSLESQLARQPPEEFADALLLVSHVLASRGWGYRAAETEEEVSPLRSALAKTRSLRSSRAEAASIWRSTPSEAKRRWLVAACDRCERFWLGSAHADQLHLLGNGVVPQQAAVAFLVLWERLSANIASCAVE